jgi:putative ABC transport system permease protein
MTEYFMQDLRFALRTLAKSRGFTAVAILTLAVGIGAATAMFSALRALVIEPFSYPRTDRLVHVWSNHGQPLSTPDFFDIREQATSFAELGVYSPQRVNLGGENAQSVRSVTCTAGVLRALGVAPALGRWITPADEEKGAPPVAVINYALWQQAFAGDRGLVGRPIRLNGGEVTVVGIMPADFEFVSPWMRTSTCQVWLPLQLERGEGKGERGSHWLCTVGRLKDGVSVKAADAEIKAIGARLKAAYPNTNTNKPFLVRSLHDEMTRDVGSRVWMLFGAVVLVLLVACANVASMLLARSARRQGEFGVRIALGATRGHIIRLALAESLLLAVGGALVGLLVAFGGVRVLQAIAPVTEARKAAITLNGGALAFSLGLTLLTAFLAGLPPAFAATRISVTGLLRADARGAAGSRARHHLLRGLIIAQIAVAFMLANGAALFSASYVKLLTANQSLATEYVLSAELDLRGERYDKRAVRTHFLEQLAERAAALPGVTAAGVTTKLPLEGGSNMDILVNDEAFDPAAHRTLAEISSITPGYFAAAGITLLRGRTLEPGDAGEKEIGVVVNRALADRCWPGADPLGKVIRPNSASPWFKAHVVGMVESVRQWGPEMDPRPEIYWPPDRAWGQTIFLIVRSPQPANRLTSVLRREVAALDPDLSPSRIRTLLEVVNEATQGQRAVTGLVDFFMAAALGLVAVGLYGTLSYHVLQRTREIGVRMAIGAARGDIVRLVFGQGAAWVLIGVIIGIGGALALASMLRAMIYGVDPLNPVSLLAGAGAVAAAAVLACWLPARRASRIDPMVALRAE